MASLKFIMDVDDDQPGHPAAAGRDATRTGAPPHSSDQATPVLAYPTQASGSDQVATQPSAASSRSSNRRRSSASNDSTDYAGYGSGASSSSAGPVLNPTNTPMRPMPNLSSSDMPVKYTPVTGRVSRAKKGVPVHICEICRPPKTFTRAEHLRRHQLSHQTPGYPCTYPGCDRAFHRPDLLARHQSRHTEPGGDDTSALRGGGEEGGQSSLAEKSSHLDLANQTGLSTGISGGQVMSSDLSAPPSESPSTPDVFTHAPSLQPSNNRDNATNQAPSSGAAAGGNEVYDIIPPSNIRASSASGTSYPSATDSFQQPQSTPSVFATQGVSLPSLSIPETNPPELYHPASPWTSSASDSTYSTPKDDLVDIANPHDTFMSDGPSLDIFGAFGGGYGNISPGGTGSAGGLLAALDLPMTGCGMTGVPSCQQLPRQVLAAVPGYVVVYWQKFHKLYPIVHRTTFETAGEDVLRWAMAAVATQYLDTKEDRLRGNQLHEHAWQELKRIPQWNLQVMQAILLCEIFARFRGRKAVTKPSKMFESVYSRVLYHNPTLFDATIPATDNAFRPEERWQAWVDAEARRRLLTACFITDVHASAYQQQKRAHEWDLTTKHISPTIPLSASSASLWDASSAAAWASILASDPESGIPTFAQTSTSLTPSDRDLFPSFDSSAILALELVHLPRLPTSTPPPPSLSLRRDDDDDATIEPLTRPRSTPGYSSTTINP
ncbi:Zinc finger protein zas1, partial [Coniochaeta hoffmannii]